MASINKYQDENVNNSYILNIIGTKRWDKPR